ncbi:MAG: DUF92 domain-containing protein [bacterium]
MIWLLGGTLSLVIALLSYRFRFLSFGGAVLAFFMGWVIFSLGRLPFSIPILVFFISSSLLSKVGRIEKMELSSLAEKSSRRDFGQVLANGVLPSLSLVIWYQFKKPFWCLLYLVALASASADTWATEIGVLSNSLPRNILNFKKVQRGASGAVSFLGMSAALAGALIIGISALYAFRSESIISLGWRHILFLTIIGFIAQTSDSLLGASTQGQYLCVKCGQITERNIHCSGFRTKLISGWKWINNDVVNFLSSLSGVLLGWIILELLF